jgi:hypothetical protein
MCRAEHRKQQRVAMRVQKLISQAGFAVSGQANPSVHAFCCSQQRPYQTMYFPLNFRVYTDFLWHWAEKTLFSEPKKPLYNALRTMDATASPRLCNGS